MPDSAHREHQKKIQSLRKINDLFEKKDPEKLLDGKNKIAVSSFILSNVKQTVRSIALSLNAHETDPKNPQGGLSPPRDNLEL